MWIAVLFTALSGAMTASDECVYNEALDARPPCMCPEVFGDSDIWEQHARDREQQLESIIEEAYTIAITHAAEWDNPTPALYRDIVLEETLVSEDRALAIVRMSDPLNVIDCPAGRYVVEVDHSLGERAAVLAVLDRLVLLDIEGELQALTPPGAPAPSFRMVFHPPWRFAKPLTPSSPTPRARPKPRPNRRRR